MDKELVVKIIDFFNGLGYSIRGIEQLDQASLVKGPPGIRIEVVPEKES